MQQTQDRTLLNWEVVHSSLEGMLDVVPPPQIHKSCIKFCDSSFDFRDAIYKCHQAHQVLELIHFLAYRLQA